MALADLKNDFVLRRIFARIEAHKEGALLDRWIARAAAACSIEDVLVSGGQFA